MSGQKRLDSSVQWPASLLSSTMTDLTTTKHQDPSKMLLSAEKEVLTELWGERNTDSSNAAN